MHLTQPPPSESRNGVIRGYYVLYKQNNRHYMGNNITVNGGDRRSYTIRNLEPYSLYVIEIQAFTRAGVSPKSRKMEVRTLEDGMYDNITEKCKV